MGATAQDPNSSSLDSSVPLRTGPQLSAATRPKTAQEDPIIRNFSVVLGGPIYDFLMRIGVFRVALPNVMRRIAAFVVVTWLPLVILSLRSGLAWGSAVKIPLLCDFSTNGRLLLALPLLLVAEVIIDPAIRRAVEEFVEAGLVQESERPDFETILHNVRRSRDSAIPDFAILVLALFPAFLFQHEWAFSAVSSWHTTASGLTAAGWWYAAVSTPIFRFLMYRWAFRYFIWGRLIRKVSKLNLHLIPTHPDHVAGLAFLNITQARTGILFTAIGCGFAGQIANRMMYEGTSLADFKFLMAGFVALAVVLGLLPLTLLAPKLARVRRAGLRAYGRLGNQYTEAFDLKWVHPTEPPSEPLLGSGDIQSLADLANSFAVVEQMRIAPITKRLTIQLAVQASIPLLPVIVLGTPTSDLVKVILKMVV